MNKQAKAFMLDGEGDAWYARNKEKLTKHDDPVIKIIMQNDISPSNVLEIGCANGWRLAALRKLYNCQVYGIDPSHQAVEEAQKQGVLARWGSARSLPYSNGVFDTVIFGFCLYLLDREDLFQAVAEADRVLADKGYIIIHDFDQAWPSKTPYKHKDGLWSYKMPYDGLFIGNPAYFGVDGLFTEEDEATPATMTTLLQKDIEGGWPCE